MIFGMLWQSHQFITRKHAGKSDGAIISIMTTEKLGHKYATNSKPNYQTEIKHKTQKSTTKQNVSHTKLKSQLHFNEHCNFSNFCPLHSMKKSPHQPL